MRINLQVLNKTGILLLSYSPSLSPYPLFVMGIFLSKYISKFGLDISCPIISLLFDDANGKSFCCEDC